MKGTRPSDDGWARAEEETWLQARREAKAIEAGNFICPWCRRYVDSGEWWTHIAANPYEDVDLFGPTLFHRRCAAPVPDKNKQWVANLRAFYNQLPIKPGDYVRLKQPLAGATKSDRLFRIIGVETDEYIGVTKDNPYYVLDISEADPRYRSRYAQSKDLELVGRPYLERRDSN